MQIACESKMGPGSEELKNAIQKCLPFILEVIGHHQNSLSWGGCVDVFGAGRSDTIRIVLEKKMNFEN